MGAGTDSRAPPAQGKGADVRKIHAIAPVTGGPFAVIILPLMVAEEAMRYLVLALALFLVACQAPQKREAPQEPGIKIGETVCSKSYRETTCTGLYQDITCRKSANFTRCISNDQKMKCRKYGRTLTCNRGTIKTVCERYRKRTVCTGGDGLVCQEKGRRGITCIRGEEKIICRHRDGKAKCVTYLMTDQSTPNNFKPPAPRYPLFPAVIWFVEQWSDDEEEEEEEED